ncbi:MAG: acyl-CoA dehydrogenase family protein [Syntrophaceae bacterium]
MSLLDAHYTQEHNIFRESAKRFFERELSPNVEQWEKDGIVPRELWKKFGGQGFLCPWLPEDYGGVGADFLYSCILMEECAKTHCGGFFFVLHTDVVVPYIYHFGSEEQKKRYLPGCATGDIITAVAMTEPNAGSDLAAIRTTAVKENGHYILNGQKTFISNGFLSNLVVVAAKTDTKANPPYTGISLFLVEDGTPGFERGRKLEKVGLHSQDTGEMAFVDCKIPKENLLGEEGKGFQYLMDRLMDERIVAAMGSQVAAEEAMRLTVDFTKNREVFGRPISRHQYISFELAKLATEVAVGRSFVDDLVLMHLNGQKDIMKASMAKYWVTEMFNRVVAQCLQFHGGYGYMEEYPIARMFRDARVQTIYAGSSEIMLLIISRCMGL